MGDWYNHFLSFLTQFSLLSILGYGVMYTAVPANGIDPLPPASRSLISPPEPVAAPLNGSTVVGKLCVSAFKDMTELKVLFL